MTVKELQDKLGRLLSEGLVAEDSEVALGTAYSYMAVKGVGIIKVHEEADREEHRLVLVLRP